MLSTIVMPIFFKYFFGFLHIASVFGLAVYGCHRLWLLSCWRRERKRPFHPAVSSGPNFGFPCVTVQLPIYNEKFVAARLIAATARMDWPRDRLEIQVLDDSTDETATIVDKVAGEWREKGVDIRIVRRSDRAGYKAGALANGMAHARGDLFAIFDADFLPGADFLKRAIPYFRVPEVGMVQARWGFLNQTHSWLTRIQSMLIGPHFAIEHRVRSGRGLFFNFNGTAGVWRRAAIESAGGWQADTVTEDLDLSYRAQLAGWRFIYLDDLVVPSEVPSTLPAFRTQQQRWAKGSIQTARKILPRLLVSDLSAAIKIEACAHLLANLGWLFGATVSLLLYPVILSRVDIGPFQLLRFDIPLMGLGIGAILLFFTVFAFARSETGSLACLPLLPIFSIGVAPAIAMAVIQGGFTRGGRFDRTPKSGGVGRTTPPREAVVYHNRSLFYFWLNIALASYCLLPVLFSWHRGTWIAIPFLLIFPAGFLLSAAGELDGQFIR